MARVQYIHRYPTLTATKPNTSGPTGTPRVIIMAHTPMYRPLSFLKKVSPTTPLPRASGGLMKNAVKARKKAIAE